MKKYSLISKVTLWVLLIIGIIVSIMFYVGGNEGELEVAGDFLSIPLFTDHMLIWVYILLGITILATIVGVLAGFAKEFKADKKSALKQLGVIALFAAVLVVAWFLGSPEKIDIIGYEGSENVGAWAQMVDAVMYSIYILLAALVGTLVWGAVYKRIKK